MIKFHRRDFLASAAGLALAGSALAQGTPKKGGVLKVSANANPSSLDPQTGGSGSDHSFLYPIFDTLIDFEPATLKALPGLAESWTNPDPTTLVLKIRAGVTFHDGTACDAAAVKFNLDRARLDPRSNIKGDLVTVEGVEATGPLEVTIKLKQPDSALLLILSDRAGMMSSPKAMQELGKDYDRKPVGAGAMKFVSWNDNEKVTYARHDKYWKPGQPYLDGLEMNVIPEINTALRAVVAGQNDFVYFLSPQQKPLIDRAKTLAAVTGPTLYCPILFLNFSKAPLDDVRVRRALNHAIDREAFAKATMAGLSEVATTVLPKAHWAYDPKLENFYKHDPDKAKALLAEAGHKDGLELHLIGYTDQRQQQRQEVIQEQLRKVGIKLRFSTFNIPEGSAAFFSKAEGHGLLSQWTGRPDPSLTFTLLYGKGSYFNSGRQEASPEVTAALAASRASADIEDRKKAFSVLQRLVLEQALSVPLLFQFELDAHHTKVKGFTSNLLGKPRFDGVWIDG
ncbi:MAG: ABC transporter substrate-binding protein [Alphaproteobacteria bacterium]|nr:ABC transporter substrate-binding protein [Alphaproteobacteria bacterium]